MRRHSDEIWLGLMISALILVIVLVIWALSSCEVEESTINETRFVEIEDAYKIDGCYYDLIHDTQTDNLYFWEDGQMLTFWNGEKPYTYTVWKSELKAERELDKAKKKEKEEKESDD